MRRNEGLASSPEPGIPEEGPETDAAFASMIEPNSESGLGEIEMPQRELPHSKFGERLQSSTNRLVDILDKHAENKAINKAHNEALAINAVYDAHTEAIAMNATESKAALTRQWNKAADDHMAEQHTEAIAMNKKFDKDVRAQSRAEKLTAAKDKLTSYGRSTLETTKRAMQLTKSAGEITARSALSTADKLKSRAETATLYARELKDTISLPIQNARKRSDERAAYREKARRERATQDDAYNSYSDNIKATADREANEVQPLYETTQAETYDSSYQRYLKEVALEKEAARAAKEIRNQKRKDWWQARGESFRKAPERISRSRIARFGRAIARFTRRTTGGAVGAIVGTAKGAVKGAVAGYREGARVVTPPISSPEKAS